MFVRFGILSIHDLCDSTRKAKRLTPIGGLQNANFGATKVRVWNHAGAVRQKEGLRVYLHAGSEFEWGGPGLSEIGTVARPQRITRNMPRDKDTPKVRRIMERIDR